MASFFRGLQSTPFQQAVEKVIDGSQPTEDWDSIMKICDHVSVSEENAKDAMKAIRKRLQTNPVTNGWRSIGLTLTLLEALTKNCGKVFHLQIAQKDFLKEFRAVLNPKNSPPTAIQEQVLGMIQTWAVAFRDDPDLKNVEQFYQECRQQGIEFPPAEPDNIIKAAVSSTGTMPQPAASARTVSQPAASNPTRPIRSGSAGSTDGTVIRQITAEQLAKLRSELDVVQTNGQIFGEMLVTLQPGEEHPDDLELLLELHKTCKQMQARIIDLLSQISIDDMTVDLLRYNDEFNNSFKTFDSYMEERERRVGPLPGVTAAPIHVASAATASAITSSPVHKQANEPALIKFDDEAAHLPTGLENLHMNSSVSESAVKSTVSQQNTATVTTRPVSNHQEPEQTSVAPTDDVQLISDEEVHIDLPPTSANTHSTA